MSEFPTGWKFLAPIFSSKAQIGWKAYLLPGTPAGNLGLPSPKSLRWAGWSVWAVWQGCHRGCHQDGCNAFSPVGGATRPGAGIEELQGWAEWMLPALELHDSNTRCVNSSHEILSPCCAQPWEHSGLWQFLTYVCPQSANTVFFNLPRAHTVWQHGEEHAVFCACALCLFS